MCGETTEWSGVGMVLLDYFEELLPMDPNLLVRQLLDSGETNEELSLVLVFGEILLDYGYDLSLIILIGLHLY